MKSYMLAGRQWHVPVTLLCKNIFDSSTAEESPGMTKAEERYVSMDVLGLVRGVTPDVRVPEMLRRLAV